MKFEFKGVVYDVCTCRCHIKGGNILHFAPCCKFTSIEYLVPDKEGSITTEEGVFKFNGDAFDERV